MSRLEEIRSLRLAKLTKLKELGLDPYPARSRKDQPNGAVVNAFGDWEGKELSLTGRLRSIRSHGKIAFADLEDESGKIQLLLRQNNLDFPDLSLLDVGDFVEAKGKVTQTSTGAVSLDVQNLRLLTKSLRPLPDSWEGLKDLDVVYRRRYLDLVLNPAHRELFQRKSKFWAANRRFMYDRGFMEVETPVLEHVTGGADARPFKTHHHALGEDFFLRISTELYQKRLIGGGFEKIFTVGPNFRNEGIDDEHLQEFYQIEWYWAYADYRDNMAMVKDMFRYIAKEVYGKTKFVKGEQTFDLADDWQELDYPKIIHDKLDVDIFKDSVEKMAKVLLQKGVKLDGGINRARLVDNLWKLIRKDIAGPAFLINEPVFVSPLAKSKVEDPRLTERFHVILAGSELGNGYSELNDPLDQLARFREQQAARDAGDDESQMMDIDYVEMLEYGMPPTSGYAHSERLFWFLENVTAREGTLFPQTRRHVEDLTRRIYGLKEEAKRKSSAKSTSTVSGEISDEVREKFPGMFYAFTVIEGVDIKKSDSSLKELTKKVLADNTQDIEKIGDIKGISEYRKLFKATGAWKLSRRPSPEALLKRVAQGKGIYNINTAVDAYNLAVIETGIGLGGFNADKIAFPVTLRLTEVGEKMHLLGDEKQTEVMEGEIAYADADKLITLDLNYRDINETKITEKTNRIILYADGAPGLTEEEVVNALEKGAKYIQQFAGGTVGNIEVVK